MGGRGVSTGSSLPLKTNLLYSYFWESAPRGWGPFTVAQTTSQQQAEGPADTVPPMAARGNYFEKGRKRGHMIERSADGQYLRHVTIRHYEWLTANKRALRSRRSEVKDGRDLLKLIRVLGGDITALLPEELDFVWWLLDSSD